MVRSGRRRSHWVVPPVMNYLLSRERPKSGMEHFYISLVDPEVGL
jgi:hypothetical protein